MWNNSSGKAFQAVLFHEEAKLYNDLVLGSFLPPAMLEELPYFFQTWLRNYIGVVIVYLVTCLAWSFVIYYWKRHIYVPKECVPSVKSVLLQIYVAMKAAPWYALTPTMNDYMIEKGWTKCFIRISDVGFVTYFECLVIFLILVEFGIYWMHRALHDVKPMYKYLHATHHIYNKQNTLSPFAGIAFHPLDGMIQAFPYTLAMFIVPFHHKTHTALLFIEGLWTANIHDCIQTKLWPTMGAGHHTIHHITYRHNYGHYTVFMDWMFGTLKNPKHNDKKPLKIS